MASKVQIANQALSRLGAERITSFSDQTVEAKAVNAVYELVVEDILSLGPWPSNKARVTLAQSVDTPTFGFAFAYTLPTNCIRVLRVNEQRQGDIEFQIEGNKLLCDESTVDILYLKMLTESSNYDSYLRQAIVWQLCYELSYQVMGDKAAADRMMERATKKIEDLLNIASTQGSPDEVISDTLIDIRGSL